MVLLMRLQQAKDHDIHHQRMVIIASLRGETSSVFSRGCHDLGLSRMFLVVRGTALLQPLMHEGMAMNCE